MFVFNKYVLILIICGVFLAGIGSTYAIIQSMPVQLSQQHMQQMMNEPQQIHTMMMNNDQHMNKMIEPMMKTMMNDPQMKKQMMNMMMQHQGMMSSMMENKLMMNMMTGMINNSVMNSEMMGNSMPMMKQQHRNQVGMMIQDSELKQQMREFILQNTNTVNHGNKVLATEKSLDGSVYVKIESSIPTPGKFLDIVETFHDKNGNILEHVNHAIHVTQDEQTVLKMSDLHSHFGEMTYYTRELHSNSPVKVEILMNGIGMEEPLTGPIDEIIVVEISEN